MSKITLHKGEDNDDDNNISQFSVILSYISAVTMCLNESAALRDIMNYNCTENINYVKSVCSEICRSHSDLCLSCIVAVCVLLKAILY